MNDTAVLDTTPAAEAGAAQPTSAASGGTGYELFGLGWRPTMSAGEYVGRHRAPDA